MKATLITIGDEILIGQIVDTNSAHVAEELTKAGVEVIEILSISDEFEQIRSAFAKAEEQSEITICTGGLGPTKDDLTKEVICAYYDDKLVLHEETLKHVEDIFVKYVQQPIYQMNRDQALVPSQAKVLFNKYGTAPGLHMTRNDRHLFCLPGVPLEMKHLIKKHIIPFIKTLPGRELLYNRTLLTAGLGESSIAMRIEDFENALPEQVKLAYLPSLGSVRLRLGSKGADETAIKSMVDQQFEHLQELLSDISVGEELSDDMSASVLHLLKDNHLTLATAESITGGGIAHKITSIPGSSKVFKGSTVTYATQSKSDVLGISATEIDKEDVVSAFTATEMAKAARKLFKSDIAIATTGNAGPSKGDSQNTVGTVFIAVATDNEVEVKEYNFGKNRERTTGRAITKAFEMLRRLVIEKLVRN